jgi:hypothetical protein
MLPNMLVDSSARRPGPAARLSLCVVFGRKILGSVGHDHGLGIAITAYVLSVGDRSRESPRPVLHVQSIDGSLGVH